MKPAANTTLRTLCKAEAAILAAYGWMPYPSDMEAEEPKRKLYEALDAVAEGLDEVRRLKDELEKAILAEADQGCRLHGEGFVCDHDPDEDYFDEWENAGRYLPRTLYPTLRKDDRG